VNLTGNDALTDLHGLDHLTRIGGALTIDFDVASSSQRVCKHRHH
jgi:hypothetical protein